MEGLRLAIGELKPSNSRLLVLVGRKISLNPIDTHALLPRQNEIFINTSDMSASSYVDKRPIKPKKSPIKRQEYTTSVWS
jgi:hypothetical protein